MDSGFSEIITLFQYWLHKSPASELKNSSITSLPAHTQIATRNFPAINPDL